MHIVTATDWGMPAIDPAHVATRTLAGVVEANVHHSDTTPPAHHDDCAGVVLGFDAYHRHHNGWACLGYHRVICSHGYVFLGRPLTIVPAAAEGHNSPIIAYCLIAKNDQATAEQWAALVTIAQHDAAQAGRALAWTTHREVEPPGYTECPGDRIEAQVAAQRRAHGKVTPAGVDDGPHQLTPRQRAAVDELTAACRHPLAHLDSKDHQALTQLRHALERAL